MEQSTSGEANRFSANQDILRVLWNPKVHYHIHKSPPRVPVLKHLTSPCLHPLLEINLNVIPFKAWCFQMVCLPQISSPKPVYAFLHHTCYIPSPHISFCLIQTPEQYSISTTDLLIMQSSPPHPNLIPPSPKYPPHHPVLRHSLNYVALSICDKVSQHAQL